ncbi:MAG: tetratricopeptide repeat protein [Bacteroidota bacterium]|jgi:TolA-binding protein|nr:tetratricopeptide repeat protein [Bacteroidota bacterium]
MKIRLIAIAMILLGLAAPRVEAQDTRESAEFKLAVQLYNDGLYAQSEDQFRSFVERFPNTSSAVEARFYLGLLQKHAKKYTEAKSSFQDFAIRHSDHPKAPDAWWNLGEIHAAEHNYAEAGQAFAKLKAFHPKSAKAPEALLAASGYFLRAKDFDNARTVLNSILIEYPSAAVRIDAQFALGQMYLASGEAERALREFSRLLTETVSADMRARIIVAIGESHMQLGNRSDAESRLREAISTYPKSMAAFEAQVKLGDMLRLFRDFPGARAQYESVTANTAAPAEVRQSAFIGLAETAMAAGDARAATEAYARLLRDASAERIEPDTYRNAAAAARRAGDFAQAETWLDRLYADTLIAYDRRVLLVDLAETAAEGRNFTAAAGRYRQYLQRYPDDPGAPFALLRIAEIEEEQFRNYPGAIEQYAAVIERYGVTPVADDAQFGRARTLETQQKDAEAAAAYEQVLVQYPASDLRARALARLRTLGQSDGIGAARSVDQLAAVIAAMHEQPGAAAVDVLLGRVYLESIGDFVRAERYFDAAVRKGVSGDEEEEAAYGAAMAVVRLAQRGDRTPAEAEARCTAFFSAHAAGARRDALAWALFVLQSSTGRPADILDAANAFLALDPATHREEVRIAYGDALLAMGRAADAETEFTRVAETTGSAATGADAWFGRARARAEQRRYDEAITDLSTYAATAPNGARIADALLLHGRLLARVGQYEDAVRRFDRLIGDFGYSNLADTARIAVIDAMLEGGMPREARTRSERYLRDVEAHPFRGADAGQAFLFAHAQTLARGGDRNEAKRALLRYAADYPDGAHIGEVYYALGQMSKDEGKIDLATAYLQQAGGMQYGAAAQRDAADLLLESGRHERAIEAYEKLAEQTSSPIEKQYAESRIVVARYRAGSVDEAQKGVAAFKAAWPEAEPVLDEFELERGKYFFRAGDYRQARDIFDDVEDSDTPAISALGMYWDGRCLEAQSKNSDAAERFAEVVKKHPRTEAALEAMMSMGRMHLRAERFPEAATQFKAVIDLGDIPESPLKEALNGLIRSYEQMDMYDVAIEMTKRFIETWPSDPTVFRKRVNMGVFYYQLRYFDQAISHLESLLTEAPPDDQAEIRYYIGESYYYKGDFTQAALEFLKVPFLVVGKTEINWTGAAYYMAGKSYENLSKFDLALGMYQKIIDTPGIDSREKAQAAKEIDRVKALIR